MCLQGKSSAKVCGAVRTEGNEEPLSISMLVPGDERAGMKLQTTSDEALKNMDTVTNEGGKVQDADAVWVWGHEVIIPDHKAFGFLPRKNIIRSTFALIIKHWLFDTLILVCILVTTVMLIIDEPEGSILARRCPSPPEVLDCRNLVPGQTIEINCARSTEEEDWGKLYGPCGSDDEPPCCFRKYRQETFRIMEIVSFP